MLDELKNLEKEADAEVRAFEILKLPARGVLAGLHYLVFVGRHGHALNGQSEPGIGEAIIGRLGHALFLLKDLPCTPYGASAQDAVEAFLETDPGQDQLKKILAYLHFSEHMPEVHRGYWRVSGQDGDLELSYRDDVFADGQARDITLSELAIPFSFQTPIEAEIWAMAKTAPKIDRPSVAKLIAEGARRYSLAMAEPDVITSKGIQRIFGFDLDRFLSIRAVVLAYAEFCDKMGFAIHSEVMKGNADEARLAEGLEWVSVNHKADFLFDFVAAASGASAAEVERFVDHYSVDYRQSPARYAGGDGFFPPFARFKEGLLFSPSLVLTFLSIRNAVFAFSKANQRAFDNFVSRDLEPVLLRQAGELLRRGGDWIVREDIAFPGGQIDLLIASPADGDVLLVQAKGTLPPQGARLTERLASRIREGVGQVQKFEALPAEVQAEVLANVLKRPVDRAGIRHAILARACFGAVEVLADGYPYAAITLPLLSLALERHRSEDRPCAIGELLQTLRETTAECYARSEYRWEFGTLEVSGTKLRLPLLRWNQDGLGRLRREWWEASYRPVT
jgi:hypothetical protein